ncbi:phage baseplate assembly protein V [Neisseria sp.]
MQQTHDFGATLQFGVVSAVDEAGHNLRVKIPALEDMETDWLPMITLAAGGNQFYSLPDEGEQVVCLLDARGENGCVIGAIYSTADKPPASNKDKWIRRFKNGTVIEHDRKTGDVLVKTGGVVTIDADTVVKKTLTVEGLFTYTAGMSGKGGGGAAAVIDGSLVATEDVMAAGISVKEHIHDGDSGGKTSPPT